MIIVNSLIIKILMLCISAMADAKLNIIDMLNKSRGDLAYTLTDVDQPLPEAVLNKIRGIAGVLAVRVL